MKSFGESMKVTISKCWWKKPCVDDIIRDWGYPTIVMKISHQQVNIDLSCISWLRDFWYFNFFSNFGQGGFGCADSEYQLKIFDFVHWRALARMLKILAMKTKWWDKFCWWQVFDVGEELCLRYRGSRIRVDHLIIT